LACDVSDVPVLLVGHVAKDGEDDEARQKTRAAVDSTRDQRVPASAQPTHVMSVLRLRFLVHRVEETICGHSWTNNECITQLCQLSNPMQ
jgi:hypothetical protein